MAETALTSTETDALEGTTDTLTDLVYHALGDATYNVNGTRQMEKLLRIAKAIGNRFRVYKDGANTYGVRPGRLDNGDDTEVYAGSTGNPLTDDLTNYIYLYISSDALAIGISTSDFPDPSTTPHLPLATIAIASGSYDYTDITDYRQLGVFNLINAMTAANANTLVGGISSNADALHVHTHTGFDEQAASGGSFVGPPFIIEFRPAAAGNLDYTVPTGRKLRVLKAWGIKTVAVGAHADDEVQLTDGTNGITSKKELDTVADGTYWDFATIDDAYNEIAAAGTLRCTTNENAAGGCDCIICALCVWVTP